MRKNNVFLQELIYVLYILDLQAPRKAQAPGHRPRWSPFWSSLVTKAPLPKFLP